MNVVTRTALREGKEAVVAARLKSAPPPQNPYSPGTKRHTYWQWGGERAARLLDQLEEIGR